MVHVADELILQTHRRTIPPHIPIAEDLHFHSARRVDTYVLAALLDSLVRVTRRVDEESYKVNIALDRQSDLVTMDGSVIMRGMTRIHEEPPSRAPFSCDPVRKWRPSLKHQSASSISSATGYLSPGIYSESWLKGYNIPPGCSSKWAVGEITFPSVASCDEN